MEPRDRHELYLRGFLSEADRERYEAEAAADGAIREALGAALERDEDWDSEMAGRARSLLAIEELFKDVLRTELTDDLPASDPRALVSLSPRARSVPETAPIVRIVNTIIIKAIQAGAQRVDIVPGRSLIEVAMRIGVVRQEMMNVPRSLLDAIMARLKVLADLDPTSSTDYQRGVIPLHYRNQQYDVEVTFTPSGEGESAFLTVVREGEPREGSQE